jgi:hypothetical protein
MVIKRRRISRRFQKYQSTLVAKCTLKEAFQQKVKKAFPGVISFKIFFSSKIDPPSCLMVIMFSPPKSQLTANALSRDIWPLNKFSFNIIYYFLLYLKIKQIANLRNNCIKLSI